MTPAPAQTQLEDLAATIAAELASVVLPGGPWPRYDEASYRAGYQDGLRWVRQWLHGRTAAAFPSPPAVPPCPDAALARRILRVLQFRPYWASALPGGSNARQSVLDWAQATDKVTVIQAGHGTRYAITNAGRAWLAEAGG